MAFQFAISKQNKNNWCWLAVAESVARHYTGTVHRQCDLAQTLVSNLPTGTICCASPVPVACNTQGNPSVSLGHVGHSRGSTTGLAPFATLASEIANGQPIAISFAYAQSRLSHVVVVSDAFTRNKVQLLRVDDPDRGIQRTVRYGTAVWANLPISWVRTYFTKL